MGLEGFASLPFTSDGAEFAFSAAALGATALGAGALGAAALGATAFGAGTLGAAALGAAAFRAGALGAAAFGATAFGAGAFVAGAFVAGTLGAAAVGATALGAGALGAGALGAAALGAAALPTETFGAVAGTVCFAVTPLLAGALDWVDTAGRSDLAGVGGDFLEGALAAGFFSFVLDIVARLRDARSRLSRSRCGLGLLKSSGGSQPKCDNRQVRGNGDLGIGIGAVDQLDRSTDEFASSGVVRHAQFAGLNFG